MMDKYTQVIHVRMEDELVEGTMFAVEELSEHKDSESTEVVQTMGYCYDEERAELWASAPKLLEACEEALDFVELSLDSSGEDTGESGLINQLQQAINQAKGE